MNQLLCDFTINLTPFFPLLYTVVGVLLGYFLSKINIKNQSLLSTKYDLLKKLYKIHSFIKNENSVELRNFINKNDEWKSFHDDIQFLSLVDNSKLTDAFSNFLKSVDVFSNTLNYSGGSSHNAMKLGVIGYDINQASKESKE